MYESFTLDNQSGGRFPVFVARYRSHWVLDRRALTWPCTDYVKYPGDATPIVDACCERTALLGEGIFPVR